MSRTPATSSETAAGPKVPTGLALAQLVEHSEARAYASLFRAAQVVQPDLGFSTSTVGSAVVLRAQRVSHSLIVNRVLGLGLSGPANNNDVAALVAAYADGGTANGSVPFGVELSPHAEPADLPVLLRAYSLRKSLAVQMLVRDGSPPPPHYAPWAQATGLRVEPVGPEQAASVARISCETFKVPDKVGELLRIGCCGQGWRRWLALDGDTPVGASLSYLHGGVAWFGWTSVLPSHRGRWVHAGIVVKQLEDAYEAGCSWVTTETAISTKEKPDAAYRNLRNFGFLEAYLRPLHIYQPRRVA